MKILQLIEKTKETFANVRTEIESGCYCASRDSLKCRCVTKACKVILRWFLKWVTQNQNVSTTCGVFWELVIHTLSCAIFRMTDLQHSWQQPEPSLMPVIFGVTSILVAYNKPGKLTDRLVCWVWFYNCQAYPQLQLCWDELSFNFDFTWPPPTPRESIETNLTKTWYAYLA